MRKIQTPQFWRGSRAVLLGAIVPATIFYDFLFGLRDFAATPPWAWATISIVPLASSIPLFLPARLISKATRAACALFILHAAAMAALLDFESWSGVAKVSLILDLWLIAAMLPSAIKLRAPGRFSQATIFWVTSLFGLCLPVALANGVVVMWRAEAIAGDRPYCIQYASQTDPFEYEPAWTLFDLSALKMQGRLLSGETTMIRSQYHALLVVNESELRFFNWSYSHENFLDEVDRVGASPALCNPKRHYARQLPISWHEPANIEISVGDRHFSIPETYRPRRTNREFSGRRDLLVANAVPPDFEAFDLKKHHLAAFWAEVLIARSEEVDLLSIFNERVARLTETHGNKEIISSEFNLNKTEWYAVEGGVGTRSTLYTAFDETGRLTRLADCWEFVPGPASPQAPPCRYMFTADGLAFSFLVKDPSQWKAVEHGLTQVISSFEIKAMP